MTHPMPPDPNHEMLAEDQVFQFECNEEVPCFTVCCHNADLLLYPYDIIRLKRRLKMSSDDFLVKHTVTAFRDNPFFPSVMLKMSEEDGHPCPFLTKQGCTVYPDRPYSCRAYPLAPAMQGDGKGSVSMGCFLVKHDHCKGHGRGPSWTYPELMKNQEMTLFNKQNMAWARVTQLLFTQNAFGAGGEDNPGMNMAFMASYNMDAFRRFVLKSTFLKRYNVPKKLIKQIKKDDVALMQLGFDWILRFLGNTGPLKENR